MNDFENDIELTDNEKEEREEARIIFAKELGELLKRGITAFGIEWVTGLTLIALEYRIHEKNKENSGNTIFKGLGRFFKSFIK